MTVQQAFELALQHHQAGRLAEAEAIYRQILAVEPRHAQVLRLLGVIAHQVGRNEAAIEFITKAIALQPLIPSFHSNLGTALRGEGQLDEAIAAYRQAITLSPDFAEAHSNLGVALQEKGQLDEAVAACQRAIALKPNYAEAHNNLGNILRQKEQLDEAIAAYRQAITLDPGLPEAHSNLGNALREKGHLDEAIAVCRRAIELKPNYSEAHSNLIYTLHFHPGFDAQAIAREHRRWNQQHAEPRRQFIQPHPNDRTPDRRLRIGYVSPDFREHPVGLFLLPLLARHDRRAFEIFCYAQVPAPDVMTRRLQAHADHWYSLVGLSDERAAALIRHHRIDILVDLSMHTAHNRLLVFARKPAPVRVTYLAYAGTSGLDTMDYRLSDPYLDPPGADESIYSERTVRLAQTYWCYQPVQTPPIAPVPALGSSHTTFGCLNNFCKVNEPTLETWMRLLRAVPGAHLLLHAPEGTHRQRTADLFRRSGIDPRRLRFVGKVPLSEYLQLYGQIDIALDPFPYGGGTTTCDALWMGVPVISVKGNTAVGRAGLSLLSNIGLPDLVANTTDEYVQLAVTLANDLPRLTHLRSTLRQRMGQSPLMDAPRFARNIEVAYREMWRQWCTEKKPASVP